MKRYHDLNHSSFRAWRSKIEDIQIKTRYLTVFNNSELKLSERNVMQSKSTSVSVLRLRKLRSGSSLQPVLPKCPVARIKIINPIEQKKSMINNHPTQSKTNIRWLLIFITVLILSTVLGTRTVHAQSEDEAEPMVQELSGILEPDSISIYRLFDLKPGQQLYVRMENTSGNLDPALVLFAGDEDPSEFSAEFRDDVSQVILAGGDPLANLSEILDPISLTWNDDFKGEFDAAIEYLIPADGSYHLMLATSPGTHSFGSYRLLIGLDAPEVLEGRGNPTGDLIAVLEKSGTSEGLSIQETTGTITEEESIQTFTLRPLRAGDKLYAYVENTSGDLTPVLILRSFNGKLLSSANLSGSESSATVEYKVERDVENYTISVDNRTIKEDNTTGSYRLLLGINAPQVLSGDARPEGSPVVREPIEVQIGVKLEQITDVDQLSEKYNAVAELRMEWQDPSLAFNPEDCQCQFRTFTGDSFVTFADEREILLPGFTLLNQQGNRWTQNEDVVVFPDGRAASLERFTTDFQAPLFDFTKFPFDEQQLYIQVESLPPDEFFIYNDAEHLSGIGELLGEEEWFIISSETQVTSEEGHDNYWLIFNISRHLNFYIFRILLPIGLIVVVTWFTFFLRDFTRRIEVSSATLLTLVAFNFTIANNIPRLGYLTFMDAVLIGSFVVTVITVLFNVYLRRLEVKDRGELALRIDRIAIWIYPLLYLVGGLLAVVFFLL